jgi:hypothetical protein
MRINSLLFVPFVLVFLVFFLSNVSAKSPCEGLGLFCLADAYNTSGNETVVVCAGTNNPVNWFNFWYNGTGPLNKTNGGVISAQYYDYQNAVANETNYNNEGITGSMNPPCIEFILNGTSAPFTNRTIQINATAYNSTDYTQTGNRSMITANYVFIETKDASGSANLPNVILMPFNNATKTFLLTDPAVTDASGYWAEHCVGFINQTINFCQPIIPGPTICMFHGSEFFGQGFNCTINSTTTMYAINMISANSSKQNVTPGQPLIINLATSTAMTMVMSENWNPAADQQMSNLAVSRYNISDYDTDELLFSISSGGGGGGPGGGEGGGGGGGMPAFIQPYKIYKITFNLNGVVYTYPFITPTNGPTGANIFVANSSAFPLNGSNCGYKTIIGKVVNESGVAVPNAVVYGQFYKSPGGAFGISFFNSSVTNANGVFTMRLPRTLPPNENPQCSGECNMFFPMYQFQIVSNITNSSVPMYFTTIDNNNNKGYFALGDTTVLPALVLKRGGQVDVNITLNNASMVMSELSKLLSLGTGLVKDATTGKFNMIKMFEQVSLPTSIITSLLSPVGNAVVDLFGKDTSMGNPESGNIISACFNTSATVSQGLATSITCNLTQPGYLNLTVYSCKDIFGDLSSSPSNSNCINIDNPQYRNQRAGSFDFWFETNGILRDSNGQAVVYISPEGVLLENLVGFNSQDSKISIPLPPGNYTFELAPAFEYSWYSGVYNKTQFTITAGNTTFVNMTRGKSWRIESMFNPSFTLSGTNQMNVSVFKPNEANDPNPLNSSYVTLTGKILYLNKSEASSQTILFSYDSSRKNFYNTTFIPSSFVSTGGKYWLLLNATNVTGNTLYTTTNLMPIHAYDFQVGLDLGGFTFGIAQNISAKIFAYNTTSNPPIGLNASSGNVTVKAYDMTGTDVTSTNTFGYIASNVSNGQGSVNITMPNTLGFYEIVVSLKTDGCVASGCANNAVGVADNWLQISNLNIKTTTDRQGYKPEDNVILTVQISNSSSGASFSGVSIEVTVDNSNTPAFATTGSDGKATFTLNPSTYAGSGSSTWSYGWHNIRIKISKGDAGGTVNLDTWYGFDVRGFDLFLRPDRPVYQTTDNVTIDMYGALGTVTIPNNGVKVDGTTLATCFDTTDPLNYGSCNNASNGNGPMPGVNYHVNDAWGQGSKRVELWNWTVGHHDVEITVSFGNSQQKFYTGFDVSAYNIIATTDSFSYNLNQNITLNVKASYLNGTALNNNNVVATLYKAQPPNDINVTEGRGTTNTTGQTTLKLNATQAGFNYIKINVGGQLQFIGVQVSTIKVTLLNAAGGNAVTNYNVAPGGTVTIYINATSGGSNIPDGSTAKAALWSFGNRVDLPDGTFTNGNATINVSIPTFAPSQVYGLEIRVSTPNGDQGFAQPSSLSVNGGNALQLSVSSDRSFSNPYKAGDTALFMVTLSYPDGSGASGHNITFEIGSEGAMPQTIGTAITGSGGTATKQFSITTNYTDGPYFLHVYITNNTDIQAYTGFLISTLRAEVTPNRNVYSPGETITLNVTLINRTSGSRVNATSGFAAIFNKDKGEIETFYDPTGRAQPYQINITISNESSSIGTYPIVVVMFLNQYQGIGFTLIDVKNSSQSLNLTLPSTITANTPFLANISSSLSGTATLRVFSPTATSVVYENTSINLAAAGTPNATVNLTITNPGIYVFNVFVSGIGTTTQIASISPPTSGTIPELWTGTSTSANATVFTTSQNVYVMSNVANSTASILTVDLTTNMTKSVSLQLTLNSSSTYYGVFSNSNLVSNRTYFVRLDTGTATGISNKMFTVS